MQVSCNGLVSGRMFSVAVHSSFGNGERTPPVVYRGWASFWAWGVTEGYGNREAFGGGVVLCMLSGVHVLRVARGLVCAVCT